MKPVEQYEVEAYVFDLITDPGRRREIEAARRTDALVRNWFDRWSVKPEIDPIFFKQGRELAEQLFDSRDITSKIAERLQNPGNSWARVSLDDIRTIGGHQRELAFEFPLAGASATAPGYKSGWESSDKSNYYFWSDANSLYLDAPVNKIPYGLGWFEIEMEDRSIFYLPKVERDEQTERWFFSESIETILGHRPPSKLLNLNFYPATELTRQMFDSEQVRKFVANLPSRCSHQKQVAEQFLNPGDDDE